MTTGYPPGAFGWLAFGATVLLTVGAVRAAELPEDWVTPGVAHDPHFEDKQLWPNLGGRENYLDAEWPGGRLYVWAHPGRNGGPRFRNSLDVTDPANWLLDGKPARELILDETADLWFPASETPYRVGFRDTDVREIVRHVTIESGAVFEGGGDGVGRNIHGNVWVKRGGGMDSQGATRFLGPRHTFFRNDNSVQDSETVTTADRGRGIMCSQYFTFNKENEASVEFLGHVTVLDEFQIHACTVIVAPDSILQPGRNATPRIHAGGRLVLLDGAFFGKWTNEFYREVDMVLEGTIQAGLPERPLTRDATLGLSFRNWQKVDFSRFGGSGTEIADVRRVSMIVRPGGALRTLAADGSDASLVVRYGGANLFNAIGDPDSPDERRRGLFNHSEFTRRFQAVPRKISIYFEADTMIDGVRFDDVHPGGLMYGDEATRAAWRRVTFGPNNVGPPEGLFQQRDSLGRSLEY
jgi:hypothetical protein